MSCGAKRTNIKNLLVHEQPANIWDAPSTTDAYRLDEGFQAQAVPEAVSRNIIKASFTPEADLMGIKVGTMTGVSEMYGSDYSDGTTKPYFNDLFRAAQLVETAIYKIPVSTISVQFVHNETVLGGTGVGRVVVPTKGTDSFIYIVISTPGFTAETITGDIAGSATATGVEAEAGWSYKFDSSVCYRLSVQAEEDGLISQMYNSVPTLQITADDSGIPKLNYEIMGVINEALSVEQWLRDGTMTTITRDLTTPPLFQDGHVKYNNGTVNYSPVVDATTTLDIAINRPARRDANNPGGVEGYVVTGREPTDTIRIDTPTNTEADIMQDWFKTNSVSIEKKFGEDVNNTFWIFSPAAKLENVTSVDQDGFMKQELQFKLTGQDDEELEIACI